ncbi:hypothetical protein [Micromonospora sp. LH3U1]|uniref:hypothetical protein n=1 Tax=Micromonospora sp. LH3U1 TaxID=3018339 RepID=UPI00234BC50B|nr:hypothetical protein [Micromonospora sp. LH3U1]WCN79451.1 hypothetical protein PCA76_20795 [Micromonospora sp. LH3U1]
MARKRKSSGRQQLILAFAAGAVIGAAGTLTLRRRRQDGGFPTGDVASEFDEGIAPTLGGRIDAPSHGPVIRPAAQHG